MTIESVTYITDLDKTYPTGSDAKSEGDDHIRNIKKALENSFSGFTGAAVTSTEAELNILDGVTATAAELNYLDISVLGTGAASKAVVLDSGDDYTWPATGVLTYGVLKDPAATTITATGAEINYLDITTLGTGAASKAVVLDAGEDYTWPATGVLKYGVLKDPAGVSITSTATEINVLDGIPPTLTATELGYVDGVTSAIQTQINTKAPSASPALTGTPTAPTAAPTTDTTQIATCEFVNDVAMNTALPTQSGNAGKFLTTNGTVASWAASPSGIFNNPITADPTCVTADSGQFYSCDGTFSITFDASFSLGDGWYIWVRNEGAGVITIAPNGSETVNGLTTLAINSGTYLVFSDGSNLFAQPVGQGSYKMEVLTGGTSWTCPNGVFVVKRTMVGGGGGGGDNSASAVTGGGGGSGGVLVKTHAVKPGTAYGYGIGGAGTGGGSGAAGNNGGDTTWTDDTTQASGGTGGGNSATSNGGAGGGTSGTADLTITGGAGKGSGDRYIGGSGGDTPLGLGMGATNGNAATGYGAGGDAGDNGTATSDGTAGCIILEYYE